MSVASSSTSTARTSPLPVALASDGLCVYEVMVRTEDVVYVKGVIEASEGLAAVFAERGGALSLAAAPGRDAELGELVRDLEREMGPVAFRVMRGADEQPGSVGAASTGDGDARE